MLHLLNKIRKGCTKQHRTPWSFKIMEVQQQRTPRKGNKSLRYKDTIKYSNKQMTKEEKQKTVEMFGAKIDRFAEISATLVEQYEQKNTAYGDSFGKSVQKYGLISALTRMSDKWNRLENLILHPDTDNGDESLIDTLNNLASYCIMTRIEIEQFNN